MASAERELSGVDVVGVGINATDTIIRLPHFPVLDSKVEVVSAEIKAGGQVASAIVACQRWGLRTRYVGKIGDDAAGEFQRSEMGREGVEAHWIVAPGRTSQSSYILVDEQSGERTVLWKRDPSIALAPSELKKDFLFGARMLLVDGHDTAAATRAARWAREEGIPVVGDFDNRYPGVEELLQYVDYPVTSKDFPERLTGEKDLLRSIRKIHADFKCQLVAATLGSAGVVAWTGERFIYSAGFKVNVKDTTGAGDIFHGAFVFGLLQGWPIQEVLEFSNAAAALNCEQAGARGGIAPIKTIRELQKSAERSEAAYSSQVLLEAASGAARFGETVGKPAPERIEGRH